MNISRDLDYVDFLAQFDKASFELYRSVPEGYISCFSCWLKSEEDLVNLWGQVSSVIAYEFQAKLDSKFEAWNIYLVFIVSDPVSKSVKYQIENDKFSMRKLVVSNVNADFCVETFLNNELLGADLKIKEEAPQEAGTEVEASALYSKVMSLTSKKKGSLNFTAEEVVALADWIADNEN
ncbi:ABC-three component system middle component 1 [Pseudomonas sp. BGr12]|uniref:ABC-three component system middle component 1 n=1 Tax=Pseudomonas sp. BGr12 TaxID=2936269 RepID=UPI0025594E17|nr:ABC-three component system middle component 1 [Pseudomonas sp. BJa5]MDL2427658.1 hypothetical protein [Pseudomonas sp. BJa5]